ncbi:MAG TPA: formimidoylglutamate deiminase [Mycobacteriales bacterium]|nr:formimidoylglutamate deiminase [Mycobacteriales bacterium]
MTAYWAAHVVLPSGPPGPARFTVEDSTFVAVEPSVEPQPGDERLSGVVLPGFANAHSHAFHRVLRGRTHRDGGTFWTWRRQMYAVAAALDPERYLALARAVFAEMVLAGYTVVGEFHYLHHAPGGRPYADRNAMGAALVQAATEAGIRLTMLDTCYLAGGLAAGGHEPLDPVQARFSDGNVEAWAGRVGELRDGPTLRTGVAAHSVRAVPEAALAAVAAAAGDRPRHIHLSEQPDENTATQAYNGCSPAELLSRTGFLGPTATAVHATHLSDADVVLLGRSGTSCCICPTTERDLADGIGPAGALRDAGSPLTLGSDSQAVVDPFEELRGLEMHERLRTTCRGRFTPAELLTAASQAGYDSLGWSGGGRIAVGAPADFVVVRSDSVRTIGAEPGQIALAATAADIDRVVVAGQIVVTDGEHRIGPVAPLLRKALEGVA